MHQEGWQGWWQGGGIALCRCGTRVAAQSTIEVAAWVGQQGVWYCVVQCSKGWWWQCQGWWQGCNLHQTKRRQSCPGWEVDEPCLPQTHIPQLFLLIIIAVFVVPFFQRKTLKKKEGGGSTILTFANAHFHTLLLLRKKSNWYQEMFKGNFDSMLCIWWGFHNVFYRPVPWWHDLRCKSKIPVHFKAKQQQPVITKMQKVLFILWLIKEY